MAGMRLRVSNAAVIAAGTSAHTILSVKPAAITPIVVHGMTISFDGVTATNAPVLVQLVTQSTDGTPGATLTPAKENQAITYTAQSVCTENFTSTEPTVSGILGEWLIHPQGGGVIEETSIAGPIVCTGRVSVKTTAANAVNCIAQIRFEE